MNEDGQRLAELLHARAEEVNVTVDLDHVKRTGSVIPVVPERHGQGADRQNRAERVAEVSATDYPDVDRAGDQPRPRWMPVAAATIVVLALGLLALTAGQESDGVQTATVPPTPEPSTSSLPAPTSSPATAVTTLGEDISVTPDFIEFGQYLVGFVGRVAKDGGRTYVLPGQIAEPPGSGEYLVNWTETAVLAAFDDSGRELWRTELDGRPTDLVVADGDPWVVREDGTLSRIDASDGRTLDSVRLSRIDSLLAAFGSVWVHTDDGAGEHVVRVDPDLTTTSVDIPSLPDDCDNCPGAPAASGDAIWVPRGDLGVAVIDAETHEVTIISRDDIGHEVLRVAFDGDVVYVASGSQVTSIIDGEVRASLSTAGISYLGPLEGTFGVLLESGRFQVLEANDEMVVNTRQVSTEGQTGPVEEIDGEAWMETGRNYDLRRVKFIPGSTEGGLPMPSRPL